MSGPRASGFGLRAALAGALAAIVSCSSAPSRPGPPPKPAPDFTRAERVVQVVVRYSVKADGPVPPQKLSGDGTMSRTALVGDRETIARLWRAISVRERREGVFCEGMPFNWVLVRVQGEPEDVLFHFHKADVLSADASGTELTISDDFYKALSAYLKGREGKPIGLLEDNDELHAP